jgi:hypothetical protein
MLINEILKPKSEEEIRKCLEECGSASEQLLGYLRINHNIGPTLGTRWLMESTDKEFDKLGRKFKNTGASQEVIAKYIFNHTNWNKFKKPCLKIEKKENYLEFHLYECNGRYRHGQVIIGKEYKYRGGYYRGRKYYNFFLNRCGFVLSGVRIKYD